VSVLADKYIDQENQRRLMNMISKVARFYAPSIIFLDAGEKPWLKKVPLEEKYLQPKRFTKHFVRLMNEIKPGDQVKLQRNWEIIFFHSLSNFLLLSSFYSV